MALSSTCEVSSMVLGKIIAVIVAIAVFVFLWRVLDVFLGFTFGILIWVIKAVLFVALLYFAYQVFSGHRHPTPR
jgi:hypothetical protein